MRVKSRDVIIEIPREYTGETLKLRILKNISNKDGMLITTNNYYVEFNNSGYFDDFEDYTTGDWKNKKKSCSWWIAKLTESNISLNNGVLTLPEDSFTYRSDNSSYQYSNSDLEFDFKLISPNADTSRDQDTLFSAITKYSDSALSAKSTGRTTCDYSLKKGYVTAINYNVGTVMYGKMTDDFSTIGWNLYQNGASYERLNSTNAITGIKYRMKIETRTEDNCVITNYYVVKYNDDGTVPEFSQQPYFTQTDGASAYTGVGTAAFYVLNGTFEIDNVQFVDKDKKVFEPVLIGDTQKPEILSVSVMSDGQNVTNIKNYSWIDIKSVISGSYAMGENADFYTAIYDNGVLKNLSKKEIVINDETVEDKIEIPADISGSWAIKNYLWYKNTMQPVADGFTGLTMGE